MKRSFFYALMLFGLMSCAHKDNIIVEERIASPEPHKISPEIKKWVAASYSLSELEQLADDPATIKQMFLQNTEYVNDYIALNGLTKTLGEIHADKTMWGAPFDQNMLGKVRNKLVRCDGTEEYIEEYYPGFENFYIAGSKIEMPYGTYDLMQAPLRAVEGKVDTVQDFWDSVVVLRRSPIIVTVHDPHEKIPKRGYPQRAEYWTHDRFTTPMPLRNGWQLCRTGDDEVIAKSRYLDSVQLVKRTFLATHPETDDRHEITQFHYQGWPDSCGAPDMELLERLHVAVDDEVERRNLPLSAPITAHCAAGLGRSPTFAISHHFRRELTHRLQNGEKIDEITLNFIKPIFDFNSQRPDQLAGAGHWQSVLLSIRRLYLKQKGLSNEEIRPVELLFEAKNQEHATRNMREEIAARKNTQ